MRTNSGNFSSAGLYSIAKKYLPGANLAKAPFNTQENVDSAVFSEIKYDGEMHGIADYNAEKNVSVFKIYILKVLDFFKRILEFVGII